MTDKALSVNSGVVVDKNITRLPDDLEDQVSKQYKKILRVSKYDDLPQRIPDDKIGEFCKREGFDLITCDTEAHLDFFDAGMKRIQVERIWESRDHPHIYRYRIIE